jgi:hypothetical protein
MLSKTLGLGEYQGWGDETGVLVVDQGIIEGFAGLVHSGVRFP